MYPHPPPPVRAVVLYWDARQRGGGRKGYVDYKHSIALPTLQSTLYGNTIQKDASIILYSLIVYRTHHRILLYALPLLSP